MTSSETQCKPVCWRRPKRVFNTTQLALLPGLRDGCLAAPEAKSGRAWSCDNIRHAAFADLEIWLCDAQMDALGIIIVEPSYVIN